MDPILFTIGSINIYSYSALMLIGIVVSIILTMLLAKKDGLDIHIFGHNILLLFIVGIIFSRILHIILMWNKYAESFYNFFYVWDGGLSMWGALITVYFVFHYICIRKKTHTAKWLDVISIGFLPMIGLGFFGKYLKGQGFGGPTDFFLGVIYENVNSPFFAVKIHPTSLYMAIVVLIIFLISIGIMLFSSRMFFGFIFYLNSLLFSLSYIIIEGFRQDVVYKIYGYNVDRTIGVFVFIITFFYFLVTIWRLYEKNIKNFVAYIRNRNSSNSI